MTEVTIARDFSVGPNTVISVRTTGYMKRNPRTKHDMEVTENIDTDNGNFKFFNQAFFTSNYVKIVLFNCYGIKSLLYMILHELGNTTGILHPSPLLGHRSLTTFLQCLLS